MLLVVLVVLGVAIFCLTKGYIVAGIVCLAGVSPKIGFLALIVTSILLFIKGHWVVGALPVLLIVWNVMGLLMTKRYINPEDVNQ